MLKRSFAVRAMCATALLVGPAAASAQSILTAVESEHSGNASADTQMVTVAGQLLSTTFGGADTRAVSNYGVNKIYASGNAGYEQYATSSWADSYTVGGTAGSMVTVSFNFAIDGNASFATGSDAEFNYKVYALRGGGWSLSGYNDNRTDWYSPFANGSTYERPILTQTVAGRVTEADMRDFDGFYNYANSGGQPGAFNSHVTYVAVGDYYAVQGPTAGPNAETRYYANGFRRFNNGVPVDPIVIPYATNAATQAQGQIRANFDANYSLLGTVALCGGDDGCASGAYPGSNLSLSFTVAAGSTFSIAALLYADDLTVGSIDFFNTAKVSGVTVSGGASLTSGSGTLSALPGGGFGYPGAVSGVPEPTTWAMLLMGFGAIGCAIRRSPVRARIRFA